MRLTRVCLEKRPLNGSSSSCCRSSHSRNTRAGILEDADADQEGLVGGEEWDPAGRSIGVNPAGDTGDVSPPPKIGLRGTVMHYVPPNLASNLVL